MKHMTNKNTEFYLLWIVRPV